MATKTYWRDKATLRGAALRGLSGVLFTCAALSAVAVTPSAQTQQDGVANTAQSACVGEYRQLVVAHPVLSGLAAGLTQNSSVKLLRPVPPRLPANRQPSYFKGRGTEKLAQAAEKADAVIAMRSIWPDDMLYPLSRRTNIRIVEIDAAQPLEGELPGVALAVSQGDALVTRPWLDGTNMIRMATLISDALIRLYPTEAEVFHRNLGVMQQRMQQLNADSTRQLAGLDNVTVVLLSEQVKSLALGLNLDIVSFAPDSDESAAQAVALKALLQQEDARVLLSHHKPDKALLDVIEAAGATLVVIKRYGDDPLTQLEGDIQNVVEALSAVKP